MDGLGVPVDLQTEGAENLMANARVVHNTVVPDPDMPTLDEVRALLDEPFDEEEVVDQVVNDE